MPRGEATRAVIVIGGGAAGLSTAAALSQCGIAATVLERDAVLGASWSRRYDALRLHTTRRFSGLAHWPIPRDRPRYLTKNEFAAYLRAYAATFALTVSLGEQVEDLRAVRNDDGGGAWQVTTNLALRRARGVVVATGRCAQAVMPAVDGLESFAGECLHASQYSRGSAYAGRRVLVVGLGNSGAEIAADLASNGAGSVTVAVRTVPPIVRRDLFGVVPVQLMGIALAPLGAPRVVDCLGGFMQRRIVGDLSPFGLGPSAWGAFEAHRPAVIDTGFLNALKQRRIMVRPALVRVDAAQAIFADGSSDAFDAIVAATGYRSGLERWLQEPEAVDDSGRPRFPSGSSGRLPGLYFVGFDDTVRGQLFEIRRQSLRVASSIGREAPAAKMWPA